MPDFRDAAKVSKLIARQFEVSRPLLDRMDRHYRHYRLDGFKPAPGEGISADDAYTTNTMRTLADKITSYIAHAGRVVRIANIGQDQRVRQVNNAAEMLAIGLWEEADRRRIRRRGEHVIQWNLAWFSVVRGGYVAGRALLIKDRAGETVPDIEPFDPRHFVIDWGDEGPIWCAHRVFKSRSAIHDEFPKFRFGETAEAEKEDDAETYEEVFDCYYRDQDAEGQDHFYNGVIIQERWARKPLEVFSVDFPVIAVPVGHIPRIAPGNAFAPGGITDIPVETMADFADSVFSPMEGVIAAKNRLMTYQMHLTAKAVKRTVFVYSRDGTKTLEENINQTATEVNLSTDNQEKIELAEVAQLTRDTSVLLDRVTDDETDAGLPPQEFGILPAPISSLALKQLGNNLEQKVTPRLLAVQTFFQTALDCMLSQFETGQYKPIRVYGRTSRRQPFDMVIEPSMIVGHGRVEVLLLPVFPEEEIAKWQIAQIALAQNSSGEPIASVQWVRDEVLKMQDRDMVSSENMATMARMSDPLARAYEMWKSAQAEGDQALAAIWYDKMQVLMIAQAVQTIQAQLALMQGQMMEQQGMQPGMQNGMARGGLNGNGSQPAPVGLQAQVAPAAGQAGFTPSPSPEAGYNTTSSRPGSLSPEDQRLAAIGLVRSR